MQLSVCRRICNWILFSCVNNSARLRSRKTSVAGKCWLFSLSSVIVKRKQRTHHTSLSAPFVSNSINIAFLNEMKLNTLMKLNTHGCLIGDVNWYRFADPGLTCCILFFLFYCFFSAILDDIWIFQLNLFLISAFFCMFLFMTTFTLHRLSARVYRGTVELVLCVCKLLYSCFSGLGGALESHSLSRAARLAEGQWLPPAWTSTSYALLQGLFRQHLQNSHRDWKHLDSPVRWALKSLHVYIQTYFKPFDFSHVLFEIFDGLPKMLSPFVFLRVDLIHLSGHFNHAAPQHVFHGTVARESCVWDVLPGSCALPQLLLAFSYCLLPLGKSITDILQVRPRPVQTCFWLSSFFFFTCMKVWRVSSSCDRRVVTLSPCLRRLDYSGIALLIMGSFVPWLYYSFYCSPQPRLIYLTIVCVLGIAAIIVAQWDRFSTPRHRPTRAGGDHVYFWN